MPLRCLLVLLCCCTAALPAFSQSLSLSIDDGYDPRIQPAAAEWNAALLRALSDAKLKTVLYPTWKRVGTPQGVQLVQAWADAGHAIGNHTYTHPNLGSSRVSLEDFIADLKQNEARLKHLSTWTPWLRFPYLKEGNIAEKRDGFRRWMQENGYRPAPVSIDASDWYYSERFEGWRAAHPGADTRPFRDAYLAHLWDRASYYEGLAKQLTGRSIPHVILLHTNAINAAFLPEVIAMFKAKGWKFVTPAEAYADPFYATAPMNLPAGESIVWAKAKQLGVEGLRYPAEDGPYEKPILDALGL